MKLFKYAVLAVFAAMALSAFGAAGAQAEAPFLKICEPKEGGQFTENECKTKLAGSTFEKVRLTAAGTRAIEGEAATNQVLEVPAAKIVITCKKLKLEKSKITGSEAGNPGTSREIVVYSECTVTGNGEPCEVTGGTIKTAEVENTLDRSNKVPVKGEKLLVLFKPVVGAFVTIGFTGAGCKLKEAAVEGSVGAEAWETAKKPVLLLENEPLGEKGYVNFPSPALATEWVDAKGAEPKEVKPKLTFVGKTATLTGTASVALAANAKKEHEHWAVAGQ